MVLMRSGKACTTFAERYQKLLTSPQIAKFETREQNCRKLQIMSMRKLPRIDSTKNLMRNCRDVC